jgi:hypothetical protein
MLELNAILYSMYKGIYLFEVRVTIDNTMIISQPWYILRLVSLPKALFSKLRSVIYQFIICRGIKSSFRLLCYILCQPISAGGLGLLDPLIRNDAYNGDGFNKYSLKINHIPKIVYEASIHPGSHGPLVPLDSPTFLRLSERLLQDLQNRKDSLNDSIWSLALADSETPGSIDDVIKKI